MEGWAANRKGRPQSVSEALQFVRWSPVMPTTGGDEELVVGEGAPEEFRMRIQLYHPEGQVPGRRATGMSVFNWLVVKQSELPGAGWGLFADRHFAPETLITAYAGVLTGRGGDTSRKVEFQGALIDVPTGTKKLYLGAHFANDPYWGMSPQQRNEYELGPLGKNTTPSGTAWGSAPQRRLGNGMRSCWITTPTTAQRRRNTCWSRGPRRGRRSAGGRIRSVA